ncbi:ABC transporter ATP-binding protein [Rhizobium sp. RU36D]|uniref:ABC transporter ATP-binding protein n=1 Tax=Rhizobium sp. RU36D TaxID=1907415 RepID=UPI0009D88B36|nr:ABC transporter ATP-binding protein [Rhizobium sp. RU36D]SMC75731.1 NitT/TauT family transport system ATP-binding protein [Rhizobium sp. RU36D]
MNISPALHGSMQLQSVSLTYGSRTVIGDLTLDIRPGEILSVVGPSGCGKTTSLRLLAGLTKPTSGTVAVSGKPLTEPQRDVAIVFQDYGKALLPWRTAYGNVALALEAMGVPKAEFPDRIHALLDLIGLEKHAQSYPGQMSGGMQQRVQIARALAQEPKVLLMDEPFGALDAMTRQTLQDELLTLSARTGVTIYFVTHDLEEAIYLSDRVVGLLPNPGRIGKVFDIALPRPRHQLTTREDRQFLEIRHALYEFVTGAEH